MVPANTGVPAIFLHRHGLARDGRLVDEGVAAGDHAVHRNPAAGPDQHHVADLYFGEASRGDLPRRSDLGSLRKRSSSSAMARLPRPTVMPSRISAISTKTVMSRAVKNSPMAEAATSAMVMESSMVIRRSNRSAMASLKMG